MKTNQQRIDELTSPIARELFQNLQDEMKHCFEFGGKSIHEMEQAAMAVVERQEISDHQRTKMEKEDRLMAYAAQWDQEQHLEDDDKTPIEYHEDGPKFHQNAVNFLRVVMNHEDWEDFEEKCADTLEG